MYVPRCTRPADRWSLVADMGQECFRGRHFGVLLFAIPLGLTLVLPVAAAAFLYKWEDFLERDDFQARFGILYELCEYK